MHDTMTTKDEAEQMRLAVAIPYWAGDEPRAMELARLLADIETKRREDVVLVFMRDAQCPDSPLLDETARYCRPKFGGIVALVSGRVAHGHPAGSNAIWGGGMELLASERRAGRLRVSTVMLCESDGGPLCLNWINRIKAAHARTLASGKRITGAVAEFSKCGIHANGGNMVFQVPVWDDYPSLHDTPDWVPYDIYHKDVLLRECRPSNVIRNEYDSYGWSPASLACMGREEVAWLHGCRDRSVLEYVKRLVASNRSPRERGDATMTTDLFLVTYPRDYEWLPYLFRSIERYVTGFRRLVMVLEQGDPEPEHPGFVTVKRCPRYPNDGTGLHFCQPVEKLRAHEHTDADRVLFVDSDCVFIAPVDLETYEHPLIVAPWDRAGQAQCWYEPTRQLLRFEPPFETMRRHPSIYATAFLSEVWDHIGGREGIARARDRGLTAVPEFNVLGNYAVMNRPEQFTILREGADDLPPRVIRQFWSHGGLTPEVLRDLEGMHLR